MDALLKKISYLEANNEMSLCNSYTRLPTLLEMEWMLDEKDFLRLLGKWWSSFDNIGLYADGLWDTSAFMGWDHNGPVRDMMTAEELKAHNALPDVVTIYRGCYQINKWGWSWSLSKEVAEKFPSYLRYCRPNEQPLLVTAKVLKRLILAVKLDRGESEIITWRPKHVSTRHIKTPANNQLVITNPLFA